jgi:hypothetical protein
MGLGAVRLVDYILPTLLVLAPCLTVAGAIWRYAWEVRLPLLPGIIAAISWFVGFAVVALLPLDLTSVSMLLVIIVTEYLLTVETIWLNRQSIVVVRINLLRIPWNVIDRPSIYRNQLYGVYGAVCTGRPSSSIGTS